MRHDQTIIFEGVAYHVTITGHREFRCPNTTYLMQINGKAMRSQLGPISYEQMIDAIKAYRDPQPLYGHAPCNPPSLRAYRPKAGAAPKTLEYLTENDDAD